jgi:hypothetical protein
MSKKHVPTKKKTLMSIDLLNRESISVDSLTNKHCTTFDAGKDETFKSTLDFNGPKEPFDHKYKSNNIHLGQRKLMLSEIQVLTQYYTRYTGHPTVLYVGAAIGTHLLALSVMFPDVKFVLYDGAKFDKRLHKHPDVFEIHEGTSGFFTDDTCKEIVESGRYNPDTLIFVSDIRLEETEFEWGVERDMMAQQKWVKMLVPKLSLLKFRMSYNMNVGDKLNYLKGDLLYGIWPKPLSGETRLLVEQENVSKYKQYDFGDYEGIMFYHNKYVRPFCLSKIPKKFVRYVTAKNNIYCSCYDCFMELTILDEYSKLFKKPFDTTVTFFGISMNRTKTLAFQKKRDKPGESD